VVINIDELVEEADWPKKTDDADPYLYDAEVMKRYPKQFHLRHDQMSHGRKRGGKGGLGKVSYPGGEVQMALASGEIYEMANYLEGNAEQHALDIVLGDDTEQMRAAAQSMIDGENLMMEDVRENYGDRHEAGLTTEQLHNSPPEGVRAFQKDLNASEQAASMNDKLKSDPEVTLETRGILADMEVDDHVKTDLDIMFGDGNHHTVAQMERGLKNNTAEYVAADMINRRWARSSGDNAVSVGVQLAAKRKFGRAKTSHLAANLGEGKDGMQKAAQISKLKTTKAYVDVTYERTQATLKANKVESLIVYRGIDRDIGGIGPGSKGVKVSAQPLSSWSTNPHVAQIFGGKVMAAKVPRSRIFSTASTGAGCLGEAEVIVIGGEFEVAVW